MLIAVASSLRRLRAMLTMFRFLFLILGGTLFLTACVQNPLERRGALAPIVRPSSPPPVGVKTAIVKPGDTVYSIATSNGLSPRALIEANRLTPPYLLRNGQSLILPEARVHVVRRGDTVSEIAYAYNVDMRSLVVLNGLQPPYLIRVGEALKLPPTRDALIIVASKPRVKRIVLTPPKKKAEAPVVRASKTEAQSASAAPVPPLPAPPLPAARPGIKAAEAKPSKQETKEELKPAVQTPAAQPPAAQSPAVQTAAVQTIAKKPQAAPPKRVSIAAPPPRSSSSFLWPVKGRVIVGFGPRESGLHNDGINISAPVGTSIKAAENGVVAYAGNELRGFGNLLLIKHSDGYTTAYAHTSEILVKRGDRVKRGQIIARVGSSGSVTQPQLHFEIRKGPRAVDPRKKLGKA